MSHKPSLRDYVLLIVFCWVCVSSNMRFCFAQNTIDGSNTVQNVYQVDMLDKTRVVGVPDLAKFELDLGFETISIPVELVRSVQLKTKRPNDERGRHVLGLANGDRFTGDVLDTSIKVKFSAGTVTLPFDQIASIKWLPSVRGSIDSLLGDTIVLFNFESSAKLIVKNSVGDRHHGKIENVKIREDDSAASQQNVASFNGSGRLTVAHDKELCPQTFTLSAWIKPTGNRDEYALIVGKTTKSTWGDGYAFAYMENDPANVYFFVNGYTSFKTHTKVPSDKWSHLVGTCDGKNVVLYLNGKQVSRTPVAQGTRVSHSTTPLTIGADASAYYWTGEIDDVVLQKGALSAESIKERFEPRD